MFSVFLSSCRDTRESLGELDKAVETLACGSCSHSISRSPKLPLVFLLINYTMSSRFLSRDSRRGRSPNQLSHIEIESE